MISNKASHVQPQAIDNFIKWVKTSHGLIGKVNMAKKLHNSLAQDDTGFVGICCFQVLSNVAWDLHQTSWQRSFNWKGCHCFRFCKSMTKEARRGERELSCRSMHWHHVLSELGHSFMGPESWTPWDWWSSPSSAL